MRNIAKCMVGLMGVCLPLAAQNDFRALGWSQNTAYHSYLMREVHQQYLERQIELSGAYASEEGVREYIDGCIARYKRIAGEFPERGALNARVVGKLKGTGYTVEKILFESLPGRTFGKADGGKWDCGFSG